MMHRKRPHLTATVAAETLVLVNNVVAETNLSVGHVLDLIVREWTESKEIEPLKCTDVPPESANLGITLNTIDARLNLIENQLSEAHILILKGE